MSALLNFNYAHFLMWYLPSRIIFSNKRSLTLPFGHYAKFEKSSYFHIDYSYVSTQGHSWSSLGILTLFPTLVSNYHLQPFVSVRTSGSKTLRLIGISYDVTLHLSTSSVIGHLKPTRVSEKYLFCLFNPCFHTTFCFFQCLRIIC